MQTICDRILIIAKGRLVAFDEPENLEKQLLTPNEITITTDATREETEKLLAGVEHVSEITIEETDSLVTARIRTEREDIHQTSRAIFMAFAGAGKVLLELALKKASLEDVFLELADATAAENSESAETLTETETEEEEVRD